MLSRILSFVLVTSLTVLAPTALRADDWSTFKTPGNAFEVKMPGKPTVRKQDTPTPFGPLEMTGYGSSDLDTNAVYVVVVAVLPPAVVQEYENDPENGLNEMIEGMITAGHGNKTSVREVTMGPNVGREFEATIFQGEGKLVGRIFVIDGKAYILLVMTPNDQNSKKDTTKFFGSFKVNRVFEI
jgi:hypothetical protein